jgi:DNA helicase HerA-like ATPase
MADMKGDLSGISQAGKMSGFIEKRLTEFQIENPEFQSCPVRFFDVFGEQGHPMRCTISQMGPDMLARLLDLNETQTGILHIVFRIADDNELLLLDMKDLRSMLDFVAKNASEFTTQYGNITPQSIGAIQRSLLALENQGGEKFFGEPAFDIQDLLSTEGGKGVMNVLAADKLMLQPKLYSTFMLWLMSELYATLPEVGDMDLPKLVFFFDEAHMLFDGTSKAMVDKIEQVIRLIRSKGVGIYFISQSPSDIPDAILGQLGNRVQHALRAYTPKDKKAVKAAAESFRPNPAFSTEEAIQSLETGEALVSFLDEKGAPSVVERCKILFPLSQIGAINDTQRQLIIRQSRIYGKYDKAVDRESAFEVLLEIAEKRKAEEEKAKLEAEKAKEKAKEDKEKAKKNTSTKPSATGKILGNVANTVARTATREITKSIFGSGSKKKSSSGGILGGFVRSILGNLLK